MIVHADNFSIYGTNAALLLNGVYAETNGASLPTDPDGISPGHVLSLGAAGAAFVRFAMEENVAVCGLACRVWFDTLPPGVQNELPRPHTIYDATGTSLADVRVQTTGRLSLYVGNTKIAETPTPAITANGWYHIETKFTQGGAGASAVEVRVEGITVIDEDSMSFQNDNLISQGLIYNAYSNTEGQTAYKAKDFVIWNGEGSYNTDFLGSVIVANLTPTSDAALNWTPSTGSTGYEILDNIPPNDAEFLSAPYDPSEPHFPDAYRATLSDLPVEATSVKALITFVRAAKSDGGDGSLQVGVISDPDGTPATALGADRPITVAQTYWRDVFETDPKTSAPWLPAAVNDADVQLNRTS